MSVTLFVIKVCSLFEQVVCRKVFPFLLLLDICDFGHFFIELNIT